MLLNAHTKSKSAIQTINQPFIVFEYLSFSAWLYNLVSGIIGFFEPVLLFSGKIKDSHFSSCDLLH